MFQTEKEMLESAEVFKAFELGETKSLAEKIGEKRIIFAGMGSSILFPGKNAKSRDSSPLTSLFSPERLSRKHLS